MVKAEEYYNLALKLNPDHSDALRSKDNLLKKNIEN